MADKKIMIKHDCPFCFNGVLIETKGDETGEKLSEMAALTCNCPQSANYRTEKKIRNGLLNDLAEQEAVEGVMNMIELVKNDFYDSVSVKFGKITYGIGKNSDGKLKFKRKKSETEEQTL